MIDVDETHESIISMERVPKGMNQENSPDIQKAYHKLTVPQMTIVVVGYVNIIVMTKS